MSFQHKAALESYRWEMTSFAVAAPSVTDRHQTVSIQSTDTTRLDAKKASHTWLINVLVFVSFYFE